MPGETGTLVKYAAETGDYRSILIGYYDDLTLLYEALNSKIMHSEFDGRLVDATVSKMISIMIHLLPKLEGSGPEMKDLVGEFENFKPWVHNVILPKNDPKEADKIPALMMLIARAYHRLNISNY